MPGLRVDLSLDGRSVLVAGGGPAALGRIAALRAAGAVVTVVESTPSDAVADLADRGLIAVVPIAAESHLRDAALVVMALEPGSADEGDLRARAASAGRLVLDRLTDPVDDPADDPTVGASAAGGPAVPGRVILVGGGPGDPGLITVAGLAAVRSADVVIADRLAPLAVLEQVRPGTTIVDVSKIPGGRSTSQEEINELLVRHAKAGRLVVRLKGGDNFVFGRGGEEWQACAAEGVAVQVIPGISSALAGPALAGIPITHRSLNQGFTVVSAHVPPGDARSTLDWSALARTGTALVIMMGVGTLAAVTRALIEHGLDPATPACTVADAGLPGQRTVGGTVADIAVRTTDAGIRPPAVTVIGSVAGFDPGEPA